MQASQRRVRRLKVNSWHQSTLASDLHALQDALNIASFPGVQPNGLLLVRKLDLGIVRPHSSNLGLSRTIDNSMQSLRIQSVCVDDEDAPDHDAVWFSDPAQAVFRLVHLVANRHQTKAWYWRVLFPDYRPEMSLEEVLRLVGKDFIDNESRLWVMASVIQQLHAQGRTQTMLASITPSLAQALLFDSGVCPSLESFFITESNSLSSTRPCVTDSWQEVIGLSIISWGRDDVRTLWMVVNALIIQNPAMTKAGQLLMQHVHTVLDQQDQKIKTDNDVFPSISSDTYADLQSRTSSQATSGSTGSDVPVTTPQSNSAEEHEYENIQSNALNIRHMNPDHQLGLNPDVDELYKSEPVISTEQKLTPTNDYEQTDSTTLEIETNSGFVQLPLYTGPVYNRQSGFVFLISLLDRLCISDCLELNPELASINLPVRVVRRLAQRMHIESDHPLLLALPKQAAVEQEKIARFVCPSLWIALSGPFSEQQPVLYRFNIKGASGQYCIADRGYKLVLYIGDDNPSALPAWIKQCQILDWPGLYDHPKLSDVETTIQLLISRYLFRYAGIGLRSLITRGGRIANTRTHLDVIFDFDQLDIRIRKAGLDINPGWVSWLGKVIQFHYESEGRDDA